MLGIFKLALKLLMNDKGKFSALLMGITFAVFLMVMMMSMFSGILLRASSSVENVGAKIWILDPAVNNVSSSIPMPNYVLDFAKSINGVKHAEPIYFGGAMVKLGDGTYQGVNVIGLDDTTLYGQPFLLEGKIEDIYAENGFIVVKDAEYEKLENPKMSAEFEINDHRGRIVGIAKVPQSGLFGVPTLYTTYNRAITYIPSSRFTLSFVLLEPKSVKDIPYIQSQIKGLGYEALTREQFIQKISNFYKFKTGMGMNVLIMTIISFIVGLSISGQTFYSFVVENLDKFGALKAIGAKGRELVMMIMVQCTFTCLIGYGLGVGLATSAMILAKLRMPDYAAQVTNTNLILAFLLVVIIAVFSSYISIRKVLEIQPFDIFRG
jgi:putative ABC transport system permease protein